MNYGEIRTQFKAILNRRDCSDSLADTFLNHALQRCTRELRTPAQEYEARVTVDALFEGFPIPNDLIQIIAVTAGASGGTERMLPFRPISRFLETSNSDSSYPQFYTRIGNKLQFRPHPSDGVELALYYYGEYEDFADDNDETVLSLVAPDLLIYGALSYASDYFMDDRGSAFEARFEQIKQALQDQSYDLEAQGAVIAPPSNLEY